MLLKSFNVNVTNGLIIPTFYSLPTYIWHAIRVSSYTLSCAAGGTIVHFISVGFSLVVEMT